MQTRPHAKKSLGQNYLQDGNIIRKIVSALAVSSDDRVLEIGPGLGALTRELAAASPTTLTLVEKDYTWAFERNREFFSQTEKDCPISGKKEPAGGRLGGGVILADAMTLAWEHLDGVRKIIGNLPYNIASPLMWEIFSRVPGFSHPESAEKMRAVFMMQKEVGQRLAAHPGSREYGALSVWVQSFVVPKLEFIVPPTVFYPRPKVDSAVLSFVPRIPSDAFPPLSVEDRLALSSLLRLTFQQRRKQLGTIMKKMAARDGELWAAVGLSPSSRPENLAPHDFLRLARHSWKLSHRAHEE